MSSYTSTQSELLYSWAQTGTAFQVTNSATETIISPTNATSPGAARLFAGFVLPGGAGLNFKTLRVVARGLITSPAASMPTVTFRAYLDSTQGTLGNALFPASGTIGGINAFTPSASQTALPFELEFDIVVLTTGTSGTCQCQGAFAAATSATAFVSQPVGAPATAITWNTAVDQYVEITGKMGTAVAASTLGLNQLLVMGLN